MSHKKAQSILGIITALIFFTAARLVLMNIFMASPESLAFSLLEFVRVLTAGARIKVTMI